jgi:hypothetical protein
VTAGLRRVVNPILPATARALLQEFVDLVTILNGLRAARPPAR